jgi:hypothetical protein
MESQLGITSVRVDSQQARKEAFDWLSDWTKHQVSVETGCIQIQRTIGTTGNVGKFRLTKFSH